VIDAVSLIRNSFPDEKLYRIRIYAFLPETNPKPGWNTGNYHSNGYAALLELNALSIGSYVPHDIRGAVRHRPHDRDEDQYRYVSLTAPFTGCYVYTNFNENGIQLDTQNELPQVVADFLFQKMLFAPMMASGNAESEFLRADNNENRSETVESLPTRRDAKQLLRSKLFQSFGIKRVLVPEDEIQEYFAFNFAHQGCLQLLYNNWREGNGFADETKNSDFGELISKQESLEKWRMSDEHLLLSRGVLEADALNQAWKPLVDEWLNPQLVARFAETAKSKPNKTDWLNAIESMFAKRFDEQFRTMGVRRFYELKEKARGEITREIRNRVEQYLLEELASGHISVVEIGKFVTTLIGHVTKKLSDFGSLRQREIQTDQDVQPIVEANRAEWNRIGILSDAFGKRDRIFNAQKDAVQRQLLARTRAVACDFAIALCKDLSKEFEDLKAEVTRFQSTVAAAERSFREQAAARCRDGDRMNLSDTVIRFYDADAVRKIGKEFLLDEKLQRSQTSGVRQAIRRVAGGRFTFNHINTTIRQDQLVDLLEKECVDSSCRAHDEMVLQSKSRRVLGVNIIEKLRDRFSPGSEEFRKFVKELVESAGTYLKLDRQQISISGEPSVAASAIDREPANSFLVLRPNPSDHKDFVERMDALFREFSTFPVEFADIEDTAEGDSSRARPRANVITLIRITNCFPLRYANQVKFLREQYDARLNSRDPARVVLEVHTEGSGSQFPSLFLADPKERKLRFSKALFVLLEAGRITQSKASGEYELARTDISGFTSEPLRLGKDLLGAVDSCTSQVVDALEQELTQLLASPELATPAQRQVLRERVVQRSNAISKEYGFGNETVRLLGQGARQAVADLGD
jgi:hypothetical protein